MDMEKMDLNTLDTLNAWQNMPASCAAAGALLANFV